jgi:hypothetical protein
MASRTFRDAVLRVTPRWLQNRNASRLLYAMAAQLDAVVDGVTAGIEMTMPGRYSDETLPIHGRQRRIRRGPSESAESYATRLKRWWGDHRRRGGPYAMLEQVRAFWAPSEFDVALVYRSGRRFQMDGDTGAVTIDDIDWSNLDDDPDKWARWWLFYEWPESIAADGSWESDGVWDDGGVWDSDLTVEDVANIRAVPEDWNNMHCFGTVVLLSDGRELWDYPGGTWDEPDGVWASEGPAQLAIG